MICCDGCEKAYHPECLKVDQNALPDIWYGPCCVNRSPVKTKLSTKNKADDTKPSATVAAVKPAAAPQQQVFVPVGKPSEMMQSALVPNQRTQPAINCQQQQSAPVGRPAGVILPNSHQRPQPAILAQMAQVTTVPWPKFVQMTQKHNYDYGDR